MRMRMRREEPKKTKLKENNETRPKKKKRFRINKSPTSNLEAILNLEKKKNKLKGRIPSLCSPIISLRNVLDKPSDEFDRDSMLVYYNFYFYI